MSLLKTHKHLHPHHIYQLEIVLLFAVGTFLFVPYYVFMKEYRLDMTVWQWYLFIPWTVFYTITLLRKRNTIPAKERIIPLKRPIGHWVLLGITLLVFHISPTDLERIYAVDLTFIIGTLFLADSYWDFRQ